MSDIREMLARLLLLVATVAVSASASSDDDDDDGSYTKEQGFGLGYAVAYFFGLVVLCYFMDVFGYFLFDKHVRDLSEDAYRSFETNRLIVERVNEEYKSAKKNSAKGKHGVVDHNTRERIIDEVSRSSKVELDREIKKEKNCFTQFINTLFCGCSCGLQRLFWIDDDPWSAEFTASLLERKSYYGCDAMSNGVILSETCLWSEYRLPLGCFEDFLFDFYNNNPIASMFLSTRGHPISRRTRRAAFISQNTLAFLLVCVWANLGYYNFYGSRDSVDEGGVITYDTIANVLVISPISIFVYQSFVFLLTMPCLARYSDNSCVKCLIETVKMIFLPLGTISVLTLWGASASYLPTDPSGVNSLAAFIYEVHIVTTANDLISNFKKYMTGANYMKLELDLYFLQIPLFTVGDWFYGYAVNKGMIITDAEKIPGCCYDGTKKEIVYSRDVQCFEAHHSFVLKFTYICPLYPDDLFDDKGIQDESFMCM